MEHLADSTFYGVLPKTGTRMWIVYLMAGIAIMLFITLLGMRKSPKSKIRNTILLIVGLLCVGAAVFIYVQGVVIERKSAVVMDNAMEGIRSYIAENTPEEPEASDSIFDLPGSCGEPKEEPDNENEGKVNKVLELNGGKYIGILEIPDLSLELPVAADCTLYTLKSSPGCYYGSPASESFVIGAHNYKSHFGNLHTLSSGMNVKFTDIDGKEYNYRIADITEVAPDEAEKVCNSGHSLALFTCNYSGARRIVVFCDLYEQK